MAETAPAAAPVAEAPKAATPAAPAKAGEERKAAAGITPVAGLDAPAQDAGKTEAPAGEASSNEPEAKPDPAAAIKFKVDLGEGEKEFTPHELINLTQEKISKAVEIHDRAVEALRSMAKNPLGTALDALTGAMGGDRQKAYAELIRQCDEAVANEYKFQNMPESERKALEWEHRAKSIEEKLKAKEAAEAEETKRTVQAEAAERLLKEFKEAIAKTGLPDIDEVKQRIVEVLQRERRAGRKPSVLQVAEHVKGEINGREEGMTYKLLDIEKLRKARPDLIEALTKGTVEDVKKAREAAKDQRPAPSELSRGTGNLPRRVPTAQILAG